MKYQWLLSAFVGLCVCIQSVSPAWADQVVTANEKQWARQALAQEAALKASQLPGNTLAVFYFDNATGRTELDALRKGIAFMLVTDLSKVKRLLVVERTKLQALVEEMGLGTSGLVAPGTAPRVGRLLGARFLVSGDIALGSDGDLPSMGSIDQVLDTRIDVSPAILDGSDKQMMTLPTVKGPVSRLFQMEKEILFALVDRLELTLSDDERSMLSRPATTNGRALYYFFMGLVYSDMQRYRQSASYYAKAMKADPAFVWPRAALNELQQRGLYQPPRTVKPILNSLRNQTSLTDSLSSDDVVRRARDPYDVELRQRLKPRPASEIDIDRDGYAPIDGDCNDTDAAIYPGADEICDDGIDQNCDGADLSCSQVDADGDGFSADVDCNDNDARIHPGAAEIQCDGIDQDCDGQDGCSGLVDADDDGFTADVDCNDNDASIYPDAEEICGDDIDQDCDGEDIACGPVDADGDGYTVGSDCNDSDASVYPGAEEVMCDGIDQDCNGSDYCPDLDQDGYTVDEDCNDDDPSVHPGAEEVMCDAIDQDCDGSDYCPDLDQDGYTVDEDCNDDDPSVHPGAEEIMCDGYDQDCNGSDFCPDMDQDGFNASVDCNDLNPTIYPGAVETCSDGIDQDCDGEDISCDSVDWDGDGYSVLGGDCDDKNAAVNPGAIEMCYDGIDNNCNGFIDEFPCDMGGGV